MQIHVINLNRSASRLLRFHSVNAHLSSVARFEAIDGSKLDAGGKSPSGALSAGNPKTFTPGAIGAALSHMKLWERCIGYNEVVTICEDDAIFNVEFENKAIAISEGLKSEWDIILWGWNFDSALCLEVLPGVGSQMRFEQDRLRQGWSAFQMSSIEARAYRLRSAFGLPCYSISPRGAATLKDRCFPLKPLVPCQTVFSGDPAVYNVAESIGIDTAMNAEFFELDAFVCFPPLVVSLNEAQHSTIQRN